MRENLEYLVLDPEGRPIGFLKTHYRPTAKGGVIALSVPQPMPIGPVSDPVAPEPSSFVHLKFTSIGSIRSWDDHYVTGWVLVCTEGDESKILQWPDTRFATIAERYALRDDQLSGHRVGTSGRPGR